jgi:hypothetical protein
MMGKGIRQNFGRVSFTRSITIEDRGQGLAKIYLRFWLLVQKRNKRCTSCVAIIVL